VPLEELNIADGEAEISNPGLDVLESTNVDLGVTWRPTRLSAVSAGVFYKSIDNFVVRADVAGQPGTPEVFDGFDQVLQPINGDSADLLGFEMSFQQAFESGLLAGFNVTLVDSEATLPLGGRDVPLPRQSDALANAVLGYEKHGLNLRLAISWRDEFLNETLDPADPAFDSIRDEHFQVDASAAYQFNEIWEAKVEVANLNGENRYEFFGDSRFNSEFERYEPVYNFAVTASF